MKWVAEYSCEQQCFHVDRIERMLENNISNMINNNGNDYQVIGFFETQEEALNYNKRIKEQLEEIRKEII